MNSFDLAQSETHRIPTGEIYSGANKTGLDINASFDRIVFCERQQAMDENTIAGLTEECIYTLHNSQRSRLVIRVVSNVDANGLRELQEKFPDAELDLYPTHGQRMNYLTLALNKDSRAVTRNTATAMRRTVNEKIAVTMDEIGNFDSFATAQLERMRANGHRFERNISPDELAILWRPFGWTVDGCRALLENRGQNELLGIRNNEGELIAAVLYSDQSYNLRNGSLHYCRHGETTEWATLPAHRQHGVITPLLTGFHSLLLEKGINDVYADLRIPDPAARGPHSISPALKSGMTIFTPTDINCVSTNHVTISGTPDTHNIYRGFLGNVDGRELRSFVKGHVNPERLTAQIRERYLNCIYE